MQSSGSEGQSSGEELTLSQFALVSYIADPLAGFLDDLRVELTPDCNPHAHVTILPPWMSHVTAGANKGIFTTAVSGTVTLTKWDINRVFELTPVSPMTVLMPPIASVSPGDQIKFFNLGTGNLITFSGNGANINGSATYTGLATTQYANATLVSDGTQWFVG